MRVATSHRCGTKVESYAVRQARTLTIRATLLGSSGRAVMLNRDVITWRQAPPQAELRRSLTPPAGGWLRRRRRRETSEDERGRNGLNSPSTRFFVFQIRTASCEEHFVFGTGEKGNRLEGSGNESTCEGAGRFGLRRFEAAMENGSGTAYEGPRPARTPSREQQSSFFFLLVLFLSRQ